jgi:ketosteroid isomerase-like protein
MDDLARLVAIEEIRRLAYAYALAMDSRDIDALVDLFVDDVQVGRDRIGHAALREDFTRQLREVGITILFVGNHLIDFAGDDRASGVVYCKAEVQQGDRWLHQAIQYRDTYARRAGRWRFVRRRHLLWYGSEVGQSPLALPPARWPAHQTGRGTLPESWESWQRFWKETEST